MITDLLETNPERPSVDDQIDHIRNNFNWKRVHDVMTHLQWEWASVGVPALGDITAYGIDLLHRVKPDSSLACGGFKAENRYGMLSLEFMVADWDTSDFCNYSI